jgi:predicted phosphoribosyltransferase
MTDFVDLADASKQVAALVAGSFPDVIFAVFPNGVSVAVEIAESKPVEIRPIYFNHETGELSIDTSGLQSSATIWVTDDGVESGLAATVIGKFFKAQGFEKVDLVVPVCARDAKAQLQFLYQSINAVVQPLMTRALKWHYELVPDVSEADANQILQQLKGRRH